MNSLPAGLRKSWANANLIMDVSITTILIVGLVRVFGRSGEGHKALARVT